MDNIEYSLEQLEDKSGWAWEVDIGNPRPEKGSSWSKNLAMLEIARIYTDHLAGAILAQAEDFGHEVMTRLLKDHEQELFEAALGYIKINEADPEGNRFMSELQGGIPESELEDGM